MRNFPALDDPVEGAPREGQLRDRPQLRDDVESFLRQLIISGRARPGETLRLGPLATELGVSITPVREALLLLAHDGWAIQEPNRGFRIAPIRRRDLADAYLANAFAASNLAARAAEASDLGVVARLRDLDGQSRSLTDEGRIERLSTLNSEIHQIIYDAADSPRLSSFAAAASRFVPRRFWTRVPGWLEHNYQGHTPIIDAIQASDADAAGKLMHEHIISAGDLLITYLDSVKLFETSEAAQP